MFFSEETFDKYSLFGSFENQLKKNAINQTDSNFEVVSFLDLCKQDTQWYSDLMNQLYERNKKLRPNYMPKKKINLNLAEMAPQVNSVPCSFSPKTPEPEVLENKVIPISSKSSNQQTPPVDSSKESTPFKRKRPEVYIEEDVPVEVIKKPNLNKNDQRANQQKKQRYVQFPWAYNPKAINIMKNWYPLQFKLGYPKRSVLNASEQKEFLNLHSRFRNRTHLNEKEVKPYKTYSHMKSMIIKERELFLEYSKKYYEIANEDYEFMSEPVEKYMSELINYLESTTSAFERFYSKIEEFTLKQLDTHQRANFEFIAKLVNLGSIPKVIVPSVSQNNQANLTISYQQISSRVPVSKDSKKMSKIPISEDENVERLAIKHNASIVLTNSSFVNLIYYLSADNQEDLKMPVQVKKLDCSDGSTRKVVFIEKPFVSKDLSKRDRNEKFFKRSLMVSFAKNSVKTRTRGGYNRQKQQKTSDSSNNSAVELFQDTSRTVNKVDDLDVNAVSQFESFGIGNVNEPDLGNKPSIEDEIFTEQVDSNKNLKSDIGTASEIIIKINEPNIKKAEKRVVEKANEISTIYSSDYDDYNDEDNGLVIDTHIEAKNVISNDCPASPTEEKIPLNKLASKNENLKDEVSMIIQSVIDSPSESENTSLNFKPKVIPLSRSEQVLNEQAARTSASLKETEIETSNNKMTLSDLLSKMHEKKFDKSVASDTAQHMLSSLAPSTQKPQVSLEQIKDFSNMECMHENVSYLLWELNGIKIIVRLSVDGYVNTESSSLNSVVLYPKLEYQPQFGGEKLSHKDYCKMWAKSFIRNSCDVMLFRINVFMNKLISTTSLNHKEILTGATNFNPQLSLNLMKNLFEKFICLTEDKYILSKESGENKLAIFKSSKNRGCLDLHFYYNDFSKSEKKSYWMPVDPEIYLPYHQQLLRVPCLFEPDQKFKNSPNKESSQKKRGGRKSGGKGKL